MITTNWDEIKNNAYPDGPFCVYVFRHDNDILYVGESRYAPSRVWEHFRKQRSNAQLSEVIDTIGANNIKVDMYSPADVVKELGVPKQRIDLLSQIYVTSYEHAIDLEGYDCRKEFESKLIYELSPLCNASGKKSDINKVMELGEKYYNQLKYANDGIYLP